MALALLSDVAMIEESSGTLTLRGAIGVSQADDLARAARSVAEGDGDVTIDCAGVEHFDLCSAQILLALKRRLDGNGRRVHWRGPPEDVTAALATTGFAETLEIRAGSTT